MTKKKSGRNYTTDRPHPYVKAQPNIPLSVLSDRDRRARLPQPSQGDPPPGRSALDQRKP